MKKKDWILIFAVLVIAGTAFGIQKFRAGDGGVVKVSVDGEVYGTYDLDTEQTIDIAGGNTLEIRGGKADVTEADCPDKVCVNQKAISKNRESIICLPNKVVISVESRQEGELDAVAN